MLTTPVNTQDRPLPPRNNCFNPTPSYRPLICYRHNWTLFFNLFYKSMWYIVTVPTLELAYLYDILH